MDSFFVHENMVSKNTAFRAHFGNWCIIFRKPTRAVRKYEFQKKFIWRRYCKACIKLRYTAYAIIMRTWHEECSTLSSYGGASFFLNSFSATYDLVGLMHFVPRPNFLYDAIGILIFICFIIAIFIRYSKILKPFLHLFRISIAAAQKY